MQQKLSEIVEIPVYSQCPVCGELHTAVCTEVDKNRLKTIILMTLNQICDKCCERGWRHSIDGDVVRLRFIYDSTEPWIIKEFVVIDRRGRGLL